MLNNINELEILRNYFFGYLLNQPIKFISSLSFAIPLIFILYYFNSVWKKNRIINIYVLLIVLLELIGGYYAAHSWNNHLFYLIFYFLESICLYLYFKEFINTTIVNKINLVIILIVLIGLIVNIVTSEYEINDFSLSIQSIGFIIIAIINFYNLLFNLKINKLSDSPLFWLNTGAFFYFTGIFFVSLFITKVLKYNDLSLNYLYNIVASLIIIFRIFLTISIWKIAKHKSN